jgi:replicative DNA helicase
VNSSNLHREIFRVAYDIYERNGQIEGHDLDHWLEAEKIVRTLREIAGDDGKKLISINIPTARSELPPV